MTGLDLLLAIVGVSVTIMVVVAMIALVPRNVERGSRAVAEDEPSRRAPAGAPAGVRG